MSEMCCLKCLNHPGIVHFSPCRLFLTILTIGTTIEMSCEEVFNCSLYVFTAFVFIFSGCPTFLRDDSGLLEMDVFHTNRIYLKREKKKYKEKAMQNQLESITNSDYDKTTTKMYALYSKKIFTEHFIQRMSKRKRLGIEMTNKSHKNTRSATAKVKESALFERNKLKF